MITCPKCVKDNQDHYKFCLGCGAELPKDAPKQFQAEDGPRHTDAPPKNPAPKATTGPKPDAAPVAVAAPEPVAEAPAQQAAAPAANGDCPQCGTPNPTGNRFCAACGYKLGAAALQGAAAQAAAAPVAAGSGVKLTALKADGSEAGEYELPAGQTCSVGRDTGTIFAGDSYLSPRHATFSMNGGSVSVQDENSLNGVYVKLAPGDPSLLAPGSVFRIGQEIIRFESMTSHPAEGGVERFGSPKKGIIGRLALVIGRETTGNAFPVTERGLHLGRERGDVLFSEDGYVSGLHCKVAPGEDGQVYLTDVGSSNGTFVRVKDGHPLSPGDILLMGQQVFRVDF